MDEVNTTYRLIDLSDRNNVGQTALTPDLALLVPGNLMRHGRLGMERSDWGDHYGKPKMIRSVVIGAETMVNEWVIGIK